MKKSKIKAIIIAVISIIILILAQNLAQVVAMLLSAIKVPEWLCFVIGGLLYVVFTYLLLKLIIEKGFKYPLADLRITCKGINWHYLLAAVVLVGAVYGLEILFLDGHFEINTFNEPFAWLFDEHKYDNIKLSTLCYTLFFQSIGAAFVEEMVFRGVLMGAMEINFNKPFALIVPSVVFGAVHLLNGAISPLSAVQLILSGFLFAYALSLVTMKSGTIINAVFFHLVWNATQTFIYISNTEFNGSIIVYYLENANQLTSGGDYGFECSIFSILGYLLLIVYVLLANKKTCKITDEKI